MTVGRITRISMNEPKIKHDGARTAVGALSPIDHKIEDSSVETFSQQLREHGLILSEDGTSATPIALGIGKEGGRPTTPLSLSFSSSSRE